MSRETVTVLLGDPNLPDRAKPAGRFTTEDLDAVERLHQALAKISGFRFETLNEHGRLLDRLRLRPPRFVLNFCDNGFANDARREPHLAALLELLDIPYSGCGPTALALCYDKSWVRAIAAGLGVPVPREVYLEPGAELPPLDYPVFIKPNSADGSVGISARSLAHGPREARDYLAALGSALPGQAVLAQEFLGGAEFSLALIGNPAHGFTALPPLEVDYARLDPALPRLLDYGSKTDPSSPYWTEVGLRPAELGPDVRASLAGHAERLFARLGLRDYARFDFRADGGGEIKLLEINPNPAWCWDGKLNVMAGFAGMSYGELLEAILIAARRRCGLA